MGSPSLPGAPVIAAERWCPQCKQWIAVSAWRKHEAGRFHAAAAAESVRAGDRDRVTSMDTERAEGAEGRTSTRGGGAS